MNKCVSQRNVIVVEWRQFDFSRENGKRFHCVDTAVYETWRGHEKKFHIKIANVVLDWNYDGAFCQLEIYTS